LLFSELADVPFEELMRIQQNIGMKKFSELRDGSGSSHATSLLSKERKEIAKRANKNR
jgi:hypothetical protein